MLLLMYRKSSSLNQCIQQVSFVFHIRAASDLYALKIKKDHENKVLSSPLILDSRSEFIKSANLTIL